MPQTARRRGRPTKPGVPGQRSKLTLLLKASTKDRLDGAAKEDGLTQSQEAERRIEASFTDQDVLTRTLRRLLHGRPNSGLALLVGEILTRVTRWSETLGEGAWYDDGDAFAAVEAVLLKVIERLRPKGCGSRDDERVHDYQRHANLPLMLLEFELTGKRRPGQDCPEWLSTLIGELGPLAGRLIPPAEPPPPAETKPVATPRRRRAA
jgi:hypothetical protein